MDLCDVARSPAKERKIDELGWREESNDSGVEETAVLRWRVRVPTAGSGGCVEADRPELV